MTQSHTSANLVEFQENLLSKIADRAVQANQASLKWLGFVVDGKSYLVPLNRIKEVLTPPEKYLNFGDWVHEGVKGGLQHRDEIWTVFQGVQCFSEQGHTKGEGWDFRLLLLRQNEMGGNIAVAVDRVIGLVSPEGLESLPREENEFGILYQAQNPNDGMVWSIWDPMLWKNAPGIAKVAN